MAKEIFATEEKIATDKEVAAIKKYKDFRGRNEKAYNLAIGLFAKAIEKGNLSAAAMALAQVNAANAQIKPLVQPESDQGAPKESGFMKCYMAQADELYATESQKDRKASVRLEASQSEAKEDTVLVDSQQTR